MPSTGCRYEVHDTPERAFDALQGQWTVIVGGSNAQLLANAIGNLLQPNALMPFRTLEAGSHQDGMLREMRMVLQKRRPGEPAGPMRRHVNTAAAAAAARGGGCRQSRYLRSLHGQLNGQQGQTVHDAYASKG